MKYKFLNTVSSPADLKTFNIKELDMLCSEMRECIVDTVSQNGGHLASNLGVVELTVALHRVFNTPKDSFVFDVGHQTYPHKLLTGRFKEFGSLRKLDGISGFSRPSESAHDAFISGHAGTSLSAAYGIAVSKRLGGEKSYTIAIAGDGALCNGMIYEAMNSMGRSDENVIFVVNDNEMSISDNVGALAKYLAGIKNSRDYFNIKDAVEKGITSIPVVGNPMKSAISATKTAVKNYLYNSNFFEDFGFTYLGPVDGHDLASLIQVFERAKKLKKPVVVHINTKKGKGYAPSQNKPNLYHGVGKFDRAKGVSGGKYTFSDKFGDTLSELASKDERIIAITAAMKDGTGLAKFAEKYKDRFFDTAIAEAHAVTFAAGLATKGAKPVVALYSTFIQRTFDQIVHDVCIEKNNVVFAIDRAGVVGDDGETHQGVFDVAMLRSVPNIEIYSPATFKGLEKALIKSLDSDSAVALRYPRGSEAEIEKCYTQNEDKDYNYIDTNSKSIIVTYGKLWGEACACMGMLKLSGLDISALQLNKIHPISEEVFKILLKYDNVLFYEEGMKNGGVGEGIAQNLIQREFKGNYHLRAIEDFVPQSTIEEALSNLKLDRRAMYNDVRAVYENKA